MIPEPYVTAAAVARYLDVKKATIMEWARNGVIPAIPLNPHVRNKKWRFRLSEIEAHLTLAQSATPRNNVVGSPRAKRG